MGRLDDKVALVTGAAHERGIGRGIARELAAEGARVAINDVAYEEMGAELARELGGRFYKADVSRREQVDELVRRVESELGPLDVVASNAGVADWQPLVEVTDESFDRIVGVNLTGAFNVGQAAARAMVARGEGGRIVFTSSVHVQMPFPTMAVYGATKQGVRALCESMAIELAPHDITVNHIGPGGCSGPQRSVARAAGRTGAAGIARADPARRPCRRPAGDGPRRRLLRLVRRRLRDGGVPSRRRRVRRREVRMSGQFVVGPVDAAREPFLELGQGGWESMVVAVRHAFLGARDYAREHDGPGRIVVVSCAAAARPIGGATLEAVAGAFLTTAAQVAAVELAERGITVNVVVPALEPDEATVSTVVDFLLGDAAQGISGAVIAADGGFSITKEGTPSPLLERPAQ